MPTLIDNVFNGPPRLNEWQRMGIATGLGAIPVIGAPLALGYEGGRAINGLVHFFAGLNKPDPLPTNSETNNPPQYAGQTSFPPNSDGLPTNSETNNPPMYGNGQTPSAALPSNLDVYNTGRLAGSPAFSPSLQQTWFPGSPVGPRFTSVASPYNVNATHGTPNPVFTGLSGPAVDAGVEIARRNIK